MVVAENGLNLASGAADSGHNCGEQKARHSAQQIFGNTKVRDIFSSSIFLQPRTLHESERKKTMNASESCTGNSESCQMIELIRT